MVARFECGLVAGSPPFPRVGLLRGARFLVSRNTRVESLICPANEEWDIDFLKPFVWVEEFDEILETHIGDQLLRDKLVWPFDK